VEVEPPEFVEVKECLLSGRLERERKDLLKRTKTQALLLG
jgi:hypothetical protein